MRRILGLAGVATLAVSTLGLTAGGATGSAAQPARTGLAAVHALAQHPTAARAADGQGFDVVSKTTDPDGATHVRLDRTYHGLDVLGGDLVVHRGVQGGWKGVSQTLAAPLSLGTTPRV